jgi:nucleoid DNA-binding protein
MLKQEIIEKITKYFKLTHFEAEKIYDDIFGNIIKGAKSDNITDILNFGEFIVKYNENNSGGNKRTVEFLPSTNFEDELRDADGLPEEQISQPEHTDPVQKTEIKPETEIKEINPELKEVSKPKLKEDFVPAFIPPVKKEVIEETKKFTLPEIKEPIYSEEEIKKEHLSVEEEIKRKRDEIIGKLNPEHDEEYHRLLHVKEGINLNVPKPIVLSKPDFEQKKEVKKEIIPEKIEPMPIIAELHENKDSEVTKTEDTSVIKNEPDKLITEVPEIKENKEEIINKEQEKLTTEEFSAKSFSDYFTEIKEEQTGKKETYEPPVIPPVQTVIPPLAVDLHKEITGQQPEEKTEIPEVPVTPVIPEVPVVSEITEPMPVSRNGSTVVNEEEKKTDDNSYYIWYKDSEPNAVDTQTMSYEYELLYQATKEAEYKSKLRIYVTTFILFFTIVLVLLIFSPVIYKYFFTPSEVQQNELIQQNDQSTNTDQPNNKADVNRLDNATLQNNTDSAKQNNPPVSETNQQNTQGEQKTGTPPAADQKTEQQKPAEQQNNTIPQGLVKNEAGWIDNKNHVVYVQLDNGKFAIQESSWDSNDKANSRISSVSRLNIAGMSGSVVKVDLGSKGVWYRTRFGEFSTLGEAKSKAEELRSK